ncbi:hypothetical protein VTN00DRAFT_9155 [Thermoascus crustaceus]|uniref:uncharacterized protein n=1 Tax=Thermoascus crustaceus TaxID=5088 RepID=UPI0037444251
MVFKPFRPPLIRNRPTQSKPADDTGDEHASHPAKRQRVSTDRDDDPEVDDIKPQAGKAASSLTSRPQLTSRKPLFQVKNLHVDAAEDSSNNHDDNENNAAKTDDSDGVEGYYNVLWRKFTTKKHKTWDGDGILSVRDGYAYLQDVSGRDMGRVMLNSATLEPGSTLSIGGKEVEVDSVLSKEEFLSGRPFLEGSKSAPAPSSTTAIQVCEAKKTSRTVMRPVARTLSQSQKQKDDAKKTLNVAAPKSMATNNAFKNPLQQSTVMLQKPTKQPIPRHDPNAPGALVMKRPDSVPKGKQIVDVVVDPLLAKHLRQHQREGVKFLYECVMGMRSFNGEGAILADDMGLGKTLQTITLLWTLLKQNPIYEAPPVVKKALIVCPVTLINNWRKEFRKWLGNERIGVFVFDDKRKRLTDFTTGKAYSVMIVGYEKLRTVQEGLTKGAGVDIVIADEGHRLKTLQNKSGQAIQSLNTAKRIILSGTPIQNDLSEFFAAVDLVNPGLLGTYKTFMKEFEGPIVRSRQPEATEKDIEKGEARNEELRNLTSMFMLRRTADILAKYLPPKTEYVLFCDPTPTQANIYRHVLASPVFQSALGNSESALLLITILKKLCNSPSLLNPKNADEVPSATITDLLSSLPPNLLRHFSPSSSGKIRVLDQLLHNLRTNTSEKIVIVSNYTSTLNLLATLLTSLSLPFLRLDGTTPSAKRQSLVDDFNRTSASACFAFLLSAKAGGTGLNLIGASRLVLFDVDWNPATDLQAMARIHRDGQKRHCRIYRILLKGGLEEKIWQRQVTKIGLADSVMDQQNKKGGSGMAQFSREELKDLFRLDEDSKCQTHELLGCECGGRGRGRGATTSSSTERKPGVEQIPDSDDEEGPAPSQPSSSSEEEEESEVEEEDLPDFPTLLKASQVDMETQERQIEIRKRRLQQKARNRHNNPDSTGSGPRKTKKKDPESAKMQQFLSQYSHIDAALLPNPATENTNAEDLDLAREVDDDDVLLPLLRDEEGNWVRYVFKRDYGLPSPATDTSTSSD